MADNILYVDACVNRSTSRTERLAQALLARLKAQGDANVTTLILEDAPIAPLSGDDVNRRFELAHAGAFDDDLFSMAKQMSQADTMVIAAPYWDLSFPSKLKVYLEHLCAQGVTFRYSEQGIPTSLCRGKRLYYVTTSGGYVGDLDFGYQQVKALFTLFFGFERAECFRAEGLDIITNDEEAIMAEALAGIESAQLD